jgi:UDP-N-acetylmuramate dehydrogenase
VLRGKLTQAESLKKLNSWHIGGNARQSYRPADVEDLCVFLQQLPADEPIIWLGLGSNVLIRDGGISGTVILTQGMLAEIKQLDVNNISVQAGVTCAKVAKYCAKHDLHGAGFLAGIPGTMGGALAMNAGAFGSETWNIVKDVVTINRHGEISEHEKSDFGIKYRDVAMPADTWFVAAHLELQAGETEQQKTEIKALLKRRAESQPIGLPSCGSVFMNPPNNHAAKLIEKCGLKGFKMGGAQVSEKHANFIINTGDATSNDIENLIAHIEQVVEQATGIKLQREVKIIGEKL